MNGGTISVPEAKVRVALERRKERAKGMRIANIQRKILPPKKLKSAIGRRKRRQQTRNTMKKLWIKEQDGVKEKNELSVLRLGKYPVFGYRASYLIFVV